MNIKVLFFARLREQLGTSGEDVEIGEGASLAALRAQLAARSAAWREALEARNLRMAVNQDMAQPDHALKAGDEVAFFPPVTGG